MLKKGDKVVMHTCGEAEHYNGKIWVCRTDEQKLHEKHDYTVVWLHGFSGCFATEYLQKVELPSDEELERLRAVEQAYQALLSATAGQQK